MTWFDWVIVGVIVLSVLTAVAQGFFVELFSLGGAILGFLLASWEAWRLAPWFEPHVKSPEVAHMAAFGVIFVMTAIVELW
jgi:membrane protein required for colicin V production